MNKRNNGSQSAILGSVWENVFFVRQKNFIYYYKYFLQNVRLFGGNWWLKYSVDNSFCSQCHLEIYIQCNHILLCFYKNSAILSKEDIFYTI